jgi:ribosomal protein L37AE/L43A
MEDNNMRKISALALVLVFAVGLAAAGCGGKAGATLVTCSACGGKVEASMVKTVEGKQICTACADRLEAAKAVGGEQGETPSCVVCGMKMAKAEMVEADGKWYCSHCAPEGAGKVEDGSASHVGKAAGGA